MALLMTVSCMWFPEKHLFSHVRGEWASVPTARNVQSRGRRGHTQDRTATKQHASPALKIHTSTVRAAEGTPLRQSDEGPLNTVGREQGESWEAGLQLDRWEQQGNKDCSSSFSWLKIKSLELIYYLYGGTFSKFLNFNKSIPNHKNLNILKLLQAIGFQSSESPLPVTNQTVCPTPDD